MVNNKGRPKCLRKVGEVPDVNYFKPRGIPLTQLEAVKLKVEELEAVKLVYYEDMKRENAADKMGVSRRTMDRELRSGLKKVIGALLFGKAIEIKGGYYVGDGESVFQCLNGKHTWKAKTSEKKPEKCPQCGETRISTKTR